MPLPLIRRGLPAVLMLSSALALSACVSVPHLATAPQIKPAQTYAAAQSLAAPAADWPKDAWWKAYGDDQLGALIDEALANAPDLAAAEARVRKAQAYAEQAGATRLPEINADAGVGLTKQSYNMGFPPAYVPHGWKGEGQGALDFTYEFDFWGKNRATLAAATSTAEAAEADAAAARLTLSTSIAAAYADLARLYADRDAAVDAVRVRSQSLDLIGQRQGQGLENQSAVDRAHAGRAAAEADLAAVDESIGLTRDRIAALMGEGPDRGLAIQPPPASTIKPFGLPQTLQADLIGRRPDVVAARLRAEAAGQKIKAAKADFYPNVNLSAAIGLQSLGLDTLVKASSIYGSVGPALSLPIFSAGRLQGAYRTSRADYDEAVANYDATLTQALQDVADVAVSERALDLRLAKSREALDASQSAWRMANERYRGGLATYLDVLTAEDALIANRRSVADLQTRAFALDIALTRALGGGFRSA